MRHQHMTIILTKDDLNTLEAGDSINIVDSLSDVIVATIYVDSDGSYKNDTIY